MRFNEIVDVIFEEVNYEIAMAQFDGVKLNKKEKVILAVKQASKVIRDYLLEVTCIHREKDYVSHADSESGWEEFTCKRCGKYWNYNYY